MRIYTNNNIILPKGSYSVKIQNIEIKSSKTGGIYVKIKYKIRKGLLKGTIFSQLINIVHSNKQAEYIRRKQLQKISEKCSINTNNIFNIKQLKKYIDKKLNINIDIQKEKFNIMSLKK